MNNWVLILVGILAALLGKNWWDSSRRTTKILEFRKRQDELREYTKEIESNINRIKKEKKGADEKYRKYFDDNDPDDSAS